MVPGADPVGTANGDRSRESILARSPINCLPPATEWLSPHGVTSLGWRSLKRLGFRAIADKAAQLPGLLREIEGHGATGELKLPEIIQRPVDARLLSLPANLKAKSLRAAFDLVSSCTSSATKLALLRSLG